MESITRRFDVKIVEVIAAKELVEHNTDLARLQSRPQAVVKLDRDVLVGALCSSISDVECANRRSVDVVLIGPISAFKNHSAGIPLGWQEVEFLLNKTKIPTFVFGELSPRHLARAITVGCQGIVLDETYWCDDIYHTIDSLAEFYLASEIRTG